MKKLLKVLSLVLVFALVMAPVVSLAGPFEATADDSVTGKLGGIQSGVGIAITVLQWIGYAVAVVMILWLGIQWMLAQPAKKAELKGKMWSMAIGIILLVGGVTILDIVWEASQTATNNLG